MLMSRRCVQCADSVTSRFRGTAPGCLTLITLVSGSTKADIRSPRGLNDGGRRWGREVRAFIVQGNFCTAAERRSVIERFVKARGFYWELCRQIKDNKRAEERRHQEQETARRHAEQGQEEACRQAEAARRRTEAERLQRQREQWKQSKAGRLEAQLAEVPQMSGRQFELFLGEVFEVSGCAVEVTPESCDQGVDVIVTNSAGPRLAVQAKNVSGPTGNAAVQEVYAGMGFYMTARWGW